MTEQRRETPPGFVPVEWYQSEHDRAQGLFGKLEELQQRFAALVGGLTNDAASAASEMVRLKAQLQQAEDPGLRQNLQVSINYAEGSLNTARSVAVRDVKPR